VDDPTLTAQDETDGVDVSATAPSAAPAWTRGGSIDRFVILERIGAGGMGVVLAAYDPDLDRRVALKILKPHLRDARASLRLQREAQAMARLAHPNVVTIFDVGLVDGQVYVAMEFVDGGTLGQWLQREPRTWREIVEIFSAAGRGLAAAHAARLVHRDFKPDNVLVGVDGRVRVADFGLASTTSNLLESAAPDARSSLGCADLMRGLTAHGGVIGTPAYMAPEQHTGGDLDERVDQFAFCVALYEALYGERPFVGDSYRRLVVEVTQGRVREPPRGSKVPAWLRAVVLRGLRVERDERYPSMDALLRALRRDPAVTRRRALGIALIAGLAGFATWGQLRGHEPAPEVCTGAGQRLVGVWDPSARARIATAFLATGKAHAQVTLDRTSAALERYASAWATMHTDACRATRVRGEQSEQLLDLRMACLERRRGQLAALVEVLAAADGAVVDKAVRATSDLEPIDGCADPEQLKVAVAPPSDPALAARVRELDARLARLTALRTVGKYKPTIDEAKILARDADATGYAPLRARASYLLGDLHGVLAERDDAVRVLLDTLPLAAEARLDSLGARTLAQLAEVHVGRGGEYQQGFEIARVAVAAAQRSGDEVAVARAYIALAWSLRFLSRYNEADAAISAALAILERRAKDNPKDLIVALTRAGTAALDGGRYQQARQYHERALAVMTTALGPDHPTLWTAHLELANVAIVQGRYRDAISEAEKALAIVERTYGPDHPDVAVPVQSMAFLFNAIGDIDHAAEYYLRGNAIYAKTMAPDHPVLAMAAAQLGDVRRRQGRYAEAKRLLDGALAVQTKAHGADSGQVALTISYLGYLARQRGDVAEARRLLERASALRKTANGAEHVEYAQTLFDQVALAVDTGRCADGMAILDRAEPILGASLPAEHPQRALAMALRARCAIDAGRATDVVPALEQAMALLEKAGMQPREVGPVRFQLARALAATAPERARSEADRAEVELASSLPERASTLAKLRAWRRHH